MAFAQLGKKGCKKNPLTSVEIEWQTEHVVKKDMHIYGEIDDRQLLFYSFGDSKFFTYDMNRLEIQCVRMVIAPYPTAFKLAGTMEGQVNFLALHPQFHQPGNNFVIIQAKDLGKSIYICKAKFIPCKEDDSRAVITIPRPKVGRQKVDLFAKRDNGLVVTQTVCNEAGEPVLKRLNYEREQMT